MRRFLTRTAADVRRRIGCEYPTLRRFTSAAHRRHFILPAMLIFGLSIAVAFAQPSRDLSEALAKEDLSAVRLAVAAARQALGQKAGAPEVADTFHPISKAGRWLTVTEAQRGFQPDFGPFEKLCWWRIGLDPTTLTQALRGPAASVGSNVAVARAKLDGADQSRAYAMAAGDFLLWATAQCERGSFSFPPRGGGHPLGVWEWGWFLEAAARQSPSNL